MYLPFHSYPAQARCVLVTVLLEHPAQIRVLFFVDHAGADLVMSYLFAYYIAATFNAQVQCRSSCGTSTGVGCREC